MTWWKPYPLVGSPLLKSEKVSYSAAGTPIDPKGDVHTIETTPYVPGIPLAYELDDDLKPVRHYYLGDPAEIQAAMAGVAAQGKTS